MVLQGTLHRMGLPIQTNTSNTDRDTISIILRRLDMAVSTIITMGRVVVVAATVANLAAREAMGVPVVMEAVISQIYSRITTES